MIWLIRYLIRNKKQNRKNIYIEKQSYPVSLEMPLTFPYFIFLGIITKSFLIAYLMPLPWQFCTNILIFTVRRKSILCSNMPG